MPLAGGAETIALLLKVEEKEEEEATFEPFIFVESTSGGRSKLLLLVFV